MPRRAAVFWSGFDPILGQVPSAEDNLPAPWGGQENQRFDDRTILWDFWMLYRRVLVALGFERTVSVIFRVEPDQTVTAIGNELSKAPPSVTGGTIVPVGCLHIKDLWSAQGQPEGSAVFWAGRLAERIEWFSWHLDRWHESRETNGDERLGPAIVAAMEVGRIAERLESMIVWVGGTGKPLRDLARREVASKKQLAAVRPNGSRAREKFAPELKKLHAKFPKTNRDGLIATLAIEVGKSAGYLRNLLKHDLDALGLPPGPRRRKNPDN